MKGNTATPFKGIGDALELGMLLFLEGERVAFHVRFLLSCTSMGSIPFHVRGVLLSLEEGRVALHVRGVLLCAFSVVISFHARGVRPVPVKGSTIMQILLFLERG